MDKQKGPVKLDLSQAETVRAVDILDTGALSLNQGDKVRFTRNDDRLGIINSAQAEVLKIDKKGAITLKQENGTQLTLTSEDTAMRFLDHAYASTVHAFQGRTVDRIIGVMDSAHPHLTHQKAFYVEISRARESALLVTDNRQKLGETLSTQTGIRIAALEATPTLEKQPEPHVPEGQVDKVFEPEATL